MGDEADRLTEQGIEAMLYGEEERRYTCKYCGEEDLIWVMTKQGWRLSDGTVLHRCEEYLDG